MRIRQLDYLRGIAVILVFGRHLDFDQMHHVGFGPVAYVLRFWQKCGWAGVDLFFVLSGFLVSGLLFEEHKKSGCVRVGRFLLRRGLKIYPAFYTLLAVTAGLFIFRGLPLPVKRFTHELIYIQNYGSPIWQHTWSLAVEEHFYVLLAIGAAAMSSTSRIPRRKALISICGGGMAVALVARSTSWLLGLTDYSYYFQTHYRIDALLCGVMVSYCYQFHPSLVTKQLRGSAATIIACGLGLASLTLVFGFTTPFMLTVGLTLVYIGFAAILLGVLSVAHRSVESQLVLLCQIDEFPREFASDHF